MAMRKRGKFTPHPSYFEILRETLKLTPLILTSNVLLWLLKSVLLCCFVLLWLLEPVLLCSFFLPSFLVVRRNGSWLPWKPNWVDDQFSWSRRWVGNLTTKTHKFVILKMFS